MFLIFLVLIFLDFSSWIFLVSVNQISVLLKNILIINPAIIVSNHMSFSGHVKDISLLGVCNNKYRHQEKNRESPERETGRRTETEMRGERRQSESRKAGENESDGEKERETGRRRERRGEGERDGEKVCVRER